MLEAPLFSSAGAKSTSTVALPAEFDGTVNEPVIHQAVKQFLANQRQGTASTKTRAEVSGGGRKPWKQKGTGRARQGSNRSPLWPGGGTAFGPKPRDYRASLPRKVKTLARQSALNARAREGAIAVVDSLGFEVPKTARIAGLLESMALATKKVLVLTNGIKRNVYLSGRNLPLVQVMPYIQASAYDVLWADTVVVEQGALTGEAPTPEPVGTAPDKPAKKPRAAKPAAKAAKKPAKAKAKSSGKPKAEKNAKKPGAKKTAAKPKKPAPKKKGSK
ncbi:MAG: 50S ribosomal protein L4 [Gemmatimonadota bacterium]